MQSFLGFAGYFRNHIKTFAHIISSLYKLCSKDVALDIIKERRDAYDRMKHELTNAHVLILPDFELPFKLYIDSACSQGLGAALHQTQIVDSEPREGVICRISRQLKYSEARNHGEKYGLLKHIEEYKQPWETINMDWVTGLVPGGKENFNACLIIAVSYSKCQHVESKKSSLVIGTQKFTSEFWTNLYEILGTNLAFSTAYHPQADGSAERMIQTMEDIIRRFCAYGMEYKDH
ncbi:hypothetical protein O181_004150 [Austropuccinia psidii MF-1]|uniref:Reverse transcriptase/retrotransposon-derived protein RNase H-like domain-containing protein n=1 Tax=Austropuccinia psidii MF-1 TaxID=1389203 RepID=A0A9Q3BFT8_9BASI|nr:hypothetical protein [Austropuccinia psidii MF-1]